MGRYKKPYEFVDLSLKKKLERELLSREEKETKKIFKVCLICGERKSLFSFSIDRRSRDNRIGACKICRSKQSLEYYYLHKEEILVRTKKYNLTHQRDRTIYFQGYQRDNREHLQKLAKVWYRKNKKKIKKRNLKYYEDNKEHCQAIRKLWIKGHKEEIKKYNREYAKTKKMKGGDKMLRKNKRGFTLIEMMVVVAIIGVLAVVGLRFYSGQVEKAKNAVTKANVGTIQTLIQGELADKISSTVWTYVNADPGTKNIFDDTNIHNPYTGEAQTANGSAGADGLPGDVYVIKEGDVFSINGNDADGLAVFDIHLEAIK